jgi:hypothetical protein
MPHEGNADRLAHTFVVYGESLLGPEYRGKIISPNSLQSRIQVTRLEPTAAPYKTVEEPFMVTTDDGWFRPVDLKVGPDGAIYVADFYERRISHVDPRDTWERGQRPDLEGAAGGLEAEERAMTCRPSARTCSSGGSENRGTGDWPAVLATAGGVWRPRGFGSGSPRRPNCPRRGALHAVGRLDEECSPRR